MSNHREHEVKALIDGLGASLKRHLRATEKNDPMFVGIHTGGAWVAQQLHSALDIKTPLSSLNISFYRDDFSRIGMNPTVKPSKMMSSVEDRDIILVDDVIHTGRTIRAALNELFDFGRPRTVTLVVLVDRGGRELPIQADIIGTTMNLEDKQQIKLTGPEPLRLKLQESS